MNVSLDDFIEASFEDLGMKNEGESRLTEINELEEPEELIPSNPNALPESDGVPTAVDESARSAPAAQEKTELEEALEYWQELVAEAIATDDTSPILHRAARDGVMKLQSSISTEAFGESLPHYHQGDHQNSMMQLLNGIAAIRRNMM